MELAPIPPQHEESAGWIRVPVTYDTGAGESVAPQSAFPGCTVKPNGAKARGIHYLAANGRKIDNEGDMAVSGQTDEFQRRSILFQAAKVSKPLFAGAQAAEAGFRTVLDGKDGSYMEHKASGQKTKLHLENGVYVFYLWIKQSEGFTRSGNP